MEIENAIFQDLESFGKKRSFQNGYGRVLHFCLEQSKNVLKRVQLCVVVTPSMLCLFILLFMVQNIIHQKIIRYIVENSVFLLLWGRQNANENKFYVFVSLVVWKSFGKVL